MGVVAPMSSLDVIFNMLTAPYTLPFQQKKLQREHLLGALLVFIGAVFTSEFGSHSDDAMSVQDFQSKLLRPIGVMYMGAELLFILILRGLVRLNKIEKPVAQALVAGVLMGNVFLLKGFASIIRSTIETGNWVGFLESPLPMCCLVTYIGTSVLGNILMTQALEAKAVVVITVFEGTHILCCCLSGCVVMLEMEGAVWWRNILYWVSVIFIGAGIIVVQGGLACCARAPALRLPLRIDECPHNPQDPVHGNLVPENSMDGVSPSGSQRRASTRDLMKTHVLPPLESIPQLPMLPEPEHLIDAGSVQVTERTADGGASVFESS